ncbi:MAG: hypothetical protein R3208_15085 [Ketobacteraceae bacterium]|nr:hypothetical protein [Ketobacteraceae bacterium]
MQSVKGYLSALSFGATAKAAALAIGLVLEILIAKTLDASHYGVYSFGIAVMAAMTLVLTRGTKNTVLKHAAILEHDRTNTRRLFHWVRRKVFRASLVVMPLALLLIVPLVHTNDSMDTRIYLIVIFLAVAVSFTQLHQSYFHARKDTVRAQLYEDIIKPSLTLLFVLMLIFLFGVAESPLAFILCYAGAAILAFLISLKKVAGSLYGKETPSADQQAEWESSRKEFFRLAILDFVFKRVDILILSFILSSAEVGGYKIAVRVAELTALPLWLSNLYVGPLISKLYADREHFRLESLLSTTSKICFVATLIGLGAFLLIGEPFLGWLGERYADMYGAILIIMAGCIYSVACGPVEAVLILTSHTRTAFRIQSITAVITLALLVSLTMLFGAFGAASAIAAGTVIWNTWMLIVIAKQMKINPSILPLRLQQKSD